MPDGKYPAKIVKLRPRDYQSGRVPGPIPGPSKWLFEFQSAIVEHFKVLCTQIDSILKLYIPVAKEKLIKSDEVPVPIVVRMCERKLAKSHRPDQILKELDCDIIAVHALGKLVVGITEESLELLKSLIIDLIEVVPKNREDWIFSKKDKQDVYRDSIEPQWVREYELIHELTSIESISAYSSSEVLESMSASSFSDCKEDGKLKVRFFTYNSDADNIIFSSFISHFRMYGIRKNNVEKLKYSHRISTYIVPFVDDEVIREMSNFPGVEAISSFTRFTFSANAVSEGKEIFQTVRPEDGKSYPKVAIVDSGISLKNEHLKPWIDKKEIFVPFNRQDNYHGDFIGGMLVYGHVANPSVENVVDTGIKILDIVVLPGKQFESIREDDLIDALEEALEKYATEYKVWNLSLGSSRLCSGIICDFTASIDELQDVYKVQFVIAAGNYTKMRDTWPKEDIFEDEEDRISLPADSLRAVTVGSIAYDHDVSTIVKKGEVAPYSRRGPGVGLSIKPDVVHYSGNPSVFPVKSINSRGELVADYGTSFSVPLVAGLLSEYYELYPEPLSKTTAKALLIHGSKHPVTGKCVDVAQDHYFYGFGLPTRLHDILYGNEHEITLIFEGIINYRKNINWIKVADFPFPPSLVLNNKVRGEILVTLVYEPHLNPTLGSEYSRSNLDVRLRATMEDGKAIAIGKGSSAGEIPDTEKWEKTQMTKELKWSPVKQLHYLSPVGRKGSGDMSLELIPTWRGVSDKEAIPFSVAITIRDPKRTASVYNEVSRGLIQSFQSSDINLKYTPTRINYRG